MKVRDIKSRAFFINLYNFCTAIITNKDFLNAKFLRAAAAEAVQHLNLLRFAECKGEFCTLFVPKKY